MDKILYTQIKILVIFIITSIIICLIFDFFRIQRKIIKTPNIITYIQDILFWIISAIILIITIVMYTNGEIRIYMILGLVIGAFIYFTAISKLFLKWGSYLFGILLNIVRFPIKKIMRFFKKYWKK